MKGSVSCGCQQMLFSEINGNKLTIPKVFMDSVFSRGEKKVVVKEIRNGICVEVIDEKSLKSLIESISKLKK